MCLNIFLGGYSGIVLTVVLVHQSILLGKVLTKLYWKHIGKTLVQVVDVSMKKLIMIITAILGIAVFARDDYRVTLPIETDFSRGLRRPLKPQWKDNEYEK